MKKREATTPPPTPLSPPTENEIADRLAKYLTDHPFNYSSAYQDCGLSVEDGERIKFRFASVFNQIEKRHVDRLEELYFKFAAGTLSNEEASTFNAAAAKSILSMKRWNPRTAPNQKPANDPRALAEKMKRENDNAIGRPAGTNPTFCNPNKNGGVQ